MSAPVGWRGPKSTHVWAIRWQLCRPELADGLRTCKQLQAVNLSGNVPFRKKCRMGHESYVSAGDKVWQTQHGPNPSKMVLNISAWASAWNVLRDQLRIAK